MPESEQTPQSILSDLKAYAERVFDWFRGSKHRTQEQVLPTTRIPLPQQPSAQEPQAPGTRTRDPLAFLDKHAPEEFPVGLMGVEQEIFINQMTAQGYDGPDAQEVEQAIQSITSTMPAGMVWPSFWTPHGLFYMDANTTPEISTYPVPVEKGSALELLRDINGGRALLKRAGAALYGDDARIKGWTMHYSFSTDKTAHERRLHDIRPFMIYFLTHPWSTATAICREGETHIEDHRREEVICDFMNDQDQLLMGLSLAAAYVYSKKEPIRLRRNQRLSRRIQEGGLQAIISTAHEQTPMGTLLKKMLKTYGDDIHAVGGDRACALLEDVLRGRYKTSIERHKDQPVVRDKGDKKWSAYNLHADAYRVTTRNYRPSHNEQIMRKVFRLGPHVKSIDYGCVVSSKTGTTYSLIAPPIAS